MMTSEKSTVDSSCVSCNCCVDDYADDSQHNHVFISTFNFWLLGVLMPIIALVGLLANTASIAVLMQKSMRSSPINIYLAGLSAFDGLLLLMSLLLYPSMSYCEMDRSDASSPWCQYFFHSALITYPVSLIMQSGSVLTLISITVDRFIAISWPLQSRNWCTVKRAHVVMAVVVAGSILYNLPSFFELTLISVSESWHDTSDAYDITSQTPVNSQKILSQTWLRKNDTYIVVYKGYLYLIFMLLLPALIMITLNIFVTIRVRRAYRLRKAMSGREEKERRCTIMAVLVVVTFLVFNSLALVNNVIEMFSSRTPSEGQKSIVYLILVTIGNVLVASNSATNFIIYCALGLRFRKMFCQLFCHCGKATFMFEIPKDNQSLVRYASVYGTPRMRSHNGHSASPVVTHHTMPLLGDDLIDSNADQHSVHGSYYSLSPNRVPKNLKSAGRAGSFL